MVMDEDDRRRRAAGGQVALQPRELRRVQHAVRVPRLVRVERDEVRAAVVEAVIGGRVLGRLRPERAVERLQIVVVAHEVVRRARQAREDLLQTHIRGRVLRGLQDPVTVQEVGAGEIAPQDGEGGSRVESSHGVHHPTERRISVKIHVGAPHPPGAAGHDVGVCDVDEAKMICHLSSSPPSGVP